MFFTDRHAALTEMRRALRPGGRIVLSAWRGLDHHPFYQTLHEVSQQRLGTSGVQAAFSLGDSDELRRLLTEAGYTDVEIESASITARFPNPEAFLRWEIDVDPAAVPALQPLDAQAQQAVLTAIYQEMAARLREVMQDDEAVLPFHAHVARARR
jgi:SAM-dependent methyltransferase